MGSSPEREVGANGSVSSALQPTGWVVSGCPSYQERPSQSSLPSRPRPSKFLFLRIAISCSGAAAGPLVRVPVVTWHCREDRDFAQVCRRPQERAALLGESLGPFDLLFIHSCFEVSLFHVLGKALGKLSEDARGSDGGEFWVH